MDMDAPAVDVVTSSDDDQIEVIKTYLKFRKYPSDYTKNQKRALRKGLQKGQYELQGKYNMNISLLLPTAQPHPMLTDINDVFISKKIYALFLYVQMCLLQEKNCTTIPMWVQTTDCRIGGCWL